MVVAGVPSVSNAGVSSEENGVNTELEPALGAPVLTGGVKVSWAKATELQKINATQAWDRFNIRNKVWRAALQILKDSLNRKRFFVFC